MPDSRLMRDKDCSWACLQDFIQHAELLGKLLGHDISLLLECPHLRKIRLQGFPVLSSHELIDDLMLTIKNLESSHLERTLVRSLTIFHVVGHRLLDIGI